MIKKLADECGYKQHEGYLLFQNTGYQEFVTEGVNIL